MHERQDGVSSVATRAERGDPSLDGAGTSPSPATSSASAHRFTRPYRPQTNGKAERMVRTLLAEWAYASPFTRPEARLEALGRFLDFYNRRRPHWSLAGQPPISRAPVNNATGKNS